MKKGDYQKKNGFTIIEVSLVLAVAGLIFLMVFIALPALNRAQRDSRRKDDVIILTEAIKKYQTNNRGALPSPNALEVDSVVTVGSGTTGADNTWAGFYNKYLGNSFKDPAGQNYKLNIKGCNAGSNGKCDLGSYDPNNVVFPNDYAMLIVLQASCSETNEGEVLSSSNPRKLAILYELEGSGIYCSEI